MPRLARIICYPIKSFDGLSVAETIVLPHGAIAEDRRFALMDQSGEYVNGKRTAKMHDLRSVYDPVARVLRIARRDGAEPERDFHLDQDRVALEAWLGEFFGLTIRLEENDAGGFPDDPEAPGPTVISTATLAEVARWFDLEIDDARRRFRANLEIDDVEPFWEDGLLVDEGRGRKFQIGSVVFEGLKPCARCPVPTRSPDTGMPLPRFVSTFSEQRARSLPPNAPRELFDHFYRLAINTRLRSGGGNRLAVGDEVAIM